MKQLIYRRDKNKLKNFLKIDFVPTSQDSEDSEDDDENSPNGLESIAENSVSTVNSTNDQKSLNVSPSVSHKRGRKPTIEIKINSKKVTFPLTIP